MNLNEFYLMVDVSIKFRFNCDENRVVRLVISSKIVITRFAAFSELQSLISGGVKFHILTASFIDGSRADVV